jgi:glycosyltransferase involved in cell wall biosynthesis
MISICICTYNRCQSLARTLDSLSISARDVDCTEVLIVDNNCNDGTAEVVESFRNKLPIRRVLETRQGLSHARNRAVAEFCGNLLLFTDDDVRLDAGWLAAYLDANRRFPEADYFGGRILPDWAGAKPRWIGDKPLPLIDGALYWFDHGAETRPVGATEQLPWSASFAVKRRLFGQVGLFRLDLGPKGTERGLGDETEFLMRARDAGAQGVYVGEALCFHPCDSRRTTLAALYHYGIASGRAHNAISDRPHRGGYCRATLFVARGILQLLRGRGDRFRQCIINSGIEMGTKKRIERLHKMKTD